MEYNDDLNYWPSFVDIMSSLFIVILTIFFMLFLSQQYLSYLVGKGENDLRELKTILEGKVISGVQVTEDGRITIGENVLFKSGKHTLTDSGTVTIRKVGLILQEFLTPERKRKFSIVVEGHTDTQGSSQDNLTLSFNRAKKVTDFWEHNLSFAITTDSLLDVVPAGYGETRLLIPTLNNVPNEFNRRVEIRVIPKFYEMLSEILNNGK